MNKQASYSPPYNADEILANYPELAEKLLNDLSHKFRAENGIELIHDEPTKKELERIWLNWQSMPDDLKEKSDAKSKELFGMSNKDHYNQLTRHACHTWQPK